MGELIFNKFGFNWFIFGDMKNIGLKNKTYVSIEDNNRIYTVTWKHEEQKILFSEVTNPDLLKFIEPNVAFENGMTITVNSGIDYYENIYRLNKDDAGNVNYTLIAIGLLNNNFHENVN